MILLGSAFLAGLLATLSPCVFPLLPVTLGYFGVRENRSKLIVFIFGQWFMLSVLGVLALLIGQVLGFSSGIPLVRIGMSVLFILFGVVSFFDWTPSFLSGLNNFFKVGNICSNLSAFLFGISSSLLYSPCVTPLLGSVLAMAASQNSIILSVLTMTLYALGFSSVILVMGLGFKKVIPKSGKWLKYIHKVSSLILIGFGLYLLV